MERYNSIVMSNTEPNTKKQETFLDGVWDFLKTLLISMIVVYTVTTFFVRPVQVIGTSMYPTLESNAIGFANIIGRKMDGLKRFDIAIIRIEEKNEYIVKRVIGLPGETVSYQNDVLYINGEAVEEPFLDPSYMASFEAPFTNNIEPITLKEGEYYCLGDNRPASRDSRYYGPFTEDKIVAKGTLIIYPFQNFGVKSW